MKMLAMTLIVLLLSLPTVTLVPIMEEQTAEAGGVHHFLDQHWESADTIFPKLHWISKWHWHFWEGHPSITRNFHWANYKNAYWTWGFRNPEDVATVSGQGWPAWAKWPYVGDWEAIHRVVKSGDFYHMNPEGKWFTGQFCDTGGCPDSH